MRRAELIEIGERIAACRDPTDDKFLELAVSGNADVIVTGDADLLAAWDSRSPEHSARGKSILI